LTGAESLEIVWMLNTFVRGLAKGDGDGIAECE
jgi:hypothetical protein